MTETTLNHKNNEAREDEVREVAVPDAGVMNAIARAELDMQITTARAYPRSIRKFVRECMEMATLNEQVAEECFYVLPRDGKTIDGPSARLAEIVVSAWGNSRAGARVVDEGADFITAQGVFHDLERNVQVTMEVRRRITGRNGRRFSADMIGVTGNAACSIAMRNAVFRGIPRAFWNDIFQAVKKAAVGDIKTLANKRADAFAFLQKMGASEPQVLAVLGVQGVEDVNLDHLATLKGLVTAIKDGETSIDEAFPPLPKPGTQAPTPGTAAEKKGVDGLAARAKAAGAGVQQSGEQPPPSDPQKLTPKQDLALECAKLASAIGMTGEELKAWTAENGVKSFAKWSDLEEVELLRLAAALRKLAKGGEAQP